MKVITITTVVFISLWMSTAHAGWGHIGHQLITPGQSSAANDIHPVFRWGHVS